MASVAAVGARAKLLSRLRRQAQGPADMKAALWDSRRRRLSRALAVPCEERLVLFDFDEEDDSNVSQNSLSEGNSPFFDTVEKKYPPTVDADEKRSPPAEVDEDMGDEMHTLLGKLRDRINYFLLEKIRRMHMYSETVSKQTSHKMKQDWKTKQQQMLKVNNKYYQQFMDLFKQWELEKQTYEKQQKHLINTLQQHKMMLRQCKIKQNQRIKLIIQMCIQYMQKLKDKNNNTFTASFVELKKEMAEYKRKYMMETQRQEIANIRKSLQSILFS